MWKLSHAGHPSRLLLNNFEITSTVVSSKPFLVSVFGVIPFVPFSTKPLKGLKWVCLGVKADAESRGMFGEAGVVSLLCCLVAESLPLADTEQVEGLGVAV